MARAPFQARATGEDPDGPPADLLELPTWLLSQLAARGNRLVAAHLGPDARRSDFAVLAVLASGGPSTQATIVRRLAMDGGDLSVLLERLDDEGLVRRRPDPSDARRKIVSITARGRSTLDALRPAVRAAQDDLLAGLDGAQRDTLLALLRSVLERGGDATGQDDRR